MLTSTDTTLPLVPTFDLRQWIDGTSADRDRLAGQIDEACREVGFLQCVGHGLPVDVVARLRQETSTFFELPLAAKLRYQSPSPEINRGYAAFASEGLSYSLGVDSAPPDLFEAFNIGSTDGNDVDLPHRYAAFYAPNIWPEEVPGLGPALLGYFAAAVHVSNLLAQIFATALGLRPDYFSPFIDRAVYTMRAINYVRDPASPNPLPGQQRMGAHTDYGLLTVLLADPVPGLEIIGPDGTWQPVTPAPGALLVNIGDMLAHWTNDRWRSTVHRVVPPPVTTAGPARRRSVALFNDANPDAWVECLPTCRDGGHPPQYEPLQAGDHLLSKLLAARTQRPSTAACTLAGRVID